MEVKKQEKEKLAEAQRKAEEEVKKREEKMWKEHAEEVNKKNLEFQAEKEKQIKV